MGVTAVRIVGARRRLGVPRPIGHPAHPLGRQPLRVSELTPPAKERTAPTGLRFASTEPPEQTAARLARTLRSRFEQEGRVWVTSAPDRVTVTVTPDPAGTGSLITVDVTTHPNRLTTLTAIGLTTRIPDSPGGDDG